MAAPILLTEQQKQQSGLGVDSRGWTQGRKAVGAREELEERAEEGSASLFWRNLIEQHQSWAVSALVHAVLFVILGLLYLETQRRQITLLSTPPLEEELNVLDEIPIDQPDVQQGGDIVDRPEPEPLEPLVDGLSAMEGIDAASVALIQVSMEKAPYNDLLCEAGLGTGVANQRGTGKGKKGFGYGLNGTGGGMGGRGGRRGNAIGRGATKESESAVDLALKWLADHQLPDGSWSFNHGVAPTCQGQCPNAGEMAEARIGATAFGVLPFLGAGQTHQVGKYQRTVGSGLMYLMSRMDVQPGGGCLGENGGRMYSHGLATIALCEAYGMQVQGGARAKQLREYDGSGNAGDGEKPKEKEVRQKPIPVPNLGPAAQASLNYVAYAQDPVGGGWRYQPRTPGDTSVVGWQLMGLLSGKMAYLRVNPACFLGATNFLNHVQMDDYGANYGYTGKERSTHATQAIGLLSRMYLGWTPDHPGITQGVHEMGAIGPSHGNMYYNYYATQVMHHFGDDPWKQWNPRMRDSLVNSQSKAGHTTGSWYFGGGDHGSGKGGRLYCTALAAMTLEVYYRHMPLYRKDVLDQGIAEEIEKQKPDDRPHDEF